MVIYLILGLVFAMFCIFVVILYQVNIMPMREQIKNIIHYKERKDYKNKALSFANENYKNTNFVDHSNEIKVSTKKACILDVIPMQNEIFIKKATFDEINNNYIPVECLHAAKLKILDINLNIDEEFTTMLFKIPHENFINGLHVIQNNFVLTIVFIHKENFEENLEYIKNKTNNELDSLKNIYSYDNNTIIIFNSKMFLIDYCGEMIYDNNHTETTNSFIETKTTTRYITPHHHPQNHNSYYSRFEIQQTLNSINRDRKSVV